MIKTIGIMTSGGDSSGMNPAVRGLVRGALFNNLKVYGIYRGYEGLIEGDIKELKSLNVGGIINRGGTILYSARSERFKTDEGKKQAYENIKKYNIDALIVVGGDGSLTGLHSFIKKTGIVGMGLPGTIDNDLFGTDYSIGFDTAVNVAMSAIDKIRDTATSHERLFLVEVMGRNAGYIATYCALAGGAEAVLIPETETRIDELCEKLAKGKKQGKKSSIVVVAEGDEAGGAFEISKKIAGKTDWDVRVSLLGHMQRGGSPTAIERISASRMGVGAIDGLIAGKKNVMVGIINDHIVYTPLIEAISKKKSINKNYLRTAYILSSV